MGRLRRVLRRILALSAVLSWAVLAAAPAALATVINLDCRVGERTNPYFQPTTITLRLDTDTRRVAVRDDLTAQVKADPVKGRIETFNEQRLTVVWRTRNVPRDPKLSYSSVVASELTQRLTVRTGGGAVLLSLTQGASSTAVREFRTTAQCEVKG